MSLRFFRTACLLLVTAAQPLAAAAETDARIVGVDPETDVAALRIAPERLVEITIRQSSKLRGGDYDVAIGNPFGLEQAITLGIARDGKPMTVAAILGHADRTTPQSGLESAETDPLHHLQGLSLTEDQRRIMVENVAPASNADRAGLMAGNRITAVENTPVTRIDQIRDAVAAAPRMIRS